MVVRSPTVSITVEEVPKVYELTIDVTPKTGKVGEVFDFHGKLTLDGKAVGNQWINLILEGVGPVASAATGWDGSYSCLWVADKTGTLNFHTEAPYVQVVSQKVSITVPVTMPIPVRAIASLLVGGLLLVASQYWR